jgi:hypothetical protein
MNKLQKIYRPLYNDWFVSEEDTGKVLAKELTERGANKIILFSNENDRLPSKKTISGEIIPADTTT